MQTPDKIETMMAELGCTGKRVTRELIDSRIEAVEYNIVVIAGQKLMYCGIRMKGGFVVVGKPATCVDPANWRDEIGQTISYDNSYSELWKLEAYHMLYEAPETDYATRAKAELAELGERITKLKNYLDGEDVKNLDVHQVELMKLQHEAMCTYFNALHERISLYIS